MALSLPLVGCLRGGTSQSPSGDSDPDATTGALRLQVVDWQNHPVPGAAIFFDGRAVNDPTDDLGSVTLKGLEPGSHQVVAVRKGMGTGRATVLIRPGETFEADVEIPSPIGIIPSFHLRTLSNAELSTRDTAEIVVRYDSGDSTDDGLFAEWSVLRGDDTIPGLLFESTELSSRFFAEEPGAYAVVFSLANRDEFTLMDTLWITVRSYSPVVILVSPNSGSEAVPGDTVVFAARVSDRDGRIEDLVFSWSVEPGSSDSFQFQPTVGDTVRWKSTLAKGVQRLVLTAQDKDGNRGSDTLEVRVILPVPAEILPITKNLNSVTVAWTEYAEDDFLLYQVYRQGRFGPPVLRAEILSRVSIVWSDDSLLFGIPYRYWVVVRNSLGKQSASDTAEVEPGIYVPIGSAITKLACDGRRPFLYALDTPNDRLFVLDAGSMETVDTLALPDSPTDFSADSEWNFLYIANQGARSVSVLDLESRAIVREIQVTPEPYRIQTLAEGRFAYSERDQWCRVRLVDGMTGRILDSTSRLYQPSLVASHSGVTLYAGESGTSEGSLTRWDMINDSLVFVEESPGTQYPYPQRSLLRNQGGEYLYYSGHKIAADNLISVIGQYGGTAYAMDSNGNRVIVEGELVATNETGGRKALPVRSTVAAVSTDDSSLYLYSSESGRIYKMDFTVLRP